MGISRYKVEGSKKVDSSRSSMVCNSCGPEMVCKIFGIGSYRTSSS